MTENDVKQDVLDVEKLFDIVVDKLNDKFQKMESTNVTSFNSETEVSKNNNGKKSEKSETTSLKVKPTQKKSFFRVFSLRVKKSSKTNDTPIKIDIPLKNCNSNDKDVEKVDEIQVVEIDKTVTADLDKVTLLKLFVCISLVKVVIW